MGNPTGFLEIKKLDRTYEPAEKRIKHFREFLVPIENEKVSKQAARCMDCGIPYCHQGCPVNNLIPDWNDLVYKHEWKKALETLHSTNNFPEFTGRICPAPCEASCTLNLTDNPVSIKAIECSIVDYGWKKGWIKPQLPLKHTDKKVAVIGSGPAGLACAQQLARAGHQVIVYEKNDRVGGLLRIGIPDFKMEKKLIDRRMAQMQSEGVEFRSNSDVGKNILIENLKDEFDAIAICIGSEVPRDLEVSGRNLLGIHFAMEFLSQQNDKISGKTLDFNQILATDKNVLVIGGGDTGSDCVGTSIRQGAKSVTQLELLSQPPETENKSLTWPNWPMKLRTSSSHEEGCDRKWSILTKFFEGNEREEVQKLNCVKVDWQTNSDGKLEMQEIKGSEFKIEADLILLAMGFIHPVHEGLVKLLKLDLDSRGNIKANESDYKTSLNKIFVAGDSRRGQSLVVWAIREGRQCAYSIDKFLMGTSNLKR